MEVFEKNPEWTKEIMQEVAEKTGLSEAQVYKWGWDQKRKSEEEDEDVPQNPGNKPAFTSGKNPTSTVKRKQKMMYKDHHH